MRINMCFVALILVTNGAVSSVYSSELTAYMSMSIDPNTGYIAGYAATFADYNTNYYYTTKVSASLQTGTQQIAYDYMENHDGPAEVWVSGQAEPGSAYDIFTTHFLITDYTYYEVVPGCASACYMWGDVYGFSFLPTSPTPISQPQTYYAPGASVPVTNSQVLARYGRQTVTYNCDVPYSQTSSGSGWSPVAGSVGRWKQKLYGFSTYDGRKVSESIPVLFDSDECYFSESIYPRVLSIDTSKVWTVGVAYSFDWTETNAWGYDEIGWAPEYVNYYSNARRSRGLSLPCYLTASQNLSISCGSNTWVYYHTNVLKPGIGDGKAISGSDGQEMVRNYP